MKLDRDATLADRLALGLLNAIVAFLTGSLIWLLLLSLISFETAQLPFELVLWFSLIMAILGMFVHDSLLTIIYARIWRILAAWFRNFFP
jgi:prepilin signal peptidase PulO-like enzyme (type II secretory pathway)